MAPRKESTERLHAVYCFPNPLHDPQVPWEAKAMGIRTRAEAQHFKNELPPSVLDWLALEPQQSRQLRERCTELISAAASSLRQRRLTARLFKACRSVLELERTRVPKTPRGAR